MSEQDRLFTVIEELELKNRSLKRIISLYEEDISKLKEKGYFKDMEIKELKKDRARLQVALERGIS